MSSPTRVVDKGASTPHDLANSTSVAIPITPIKIKVAEFGLTVQAPTPPISPGDFNFVELGGTVGVATADITTAPTITLTVTRRTIGIANETIIFSTSQTLTLASQKETIAFVAVDGGVDGILPNGNYGYALYVERSVLGIEPANPPFINGPVSFTGTSYVREV